MQQYLSALILIGVAVVIGILYNAWTTGMFTSKASAVSKNSNGVITGAVDFSVVSPPAGQSFTFTKINTNDSTIYYANITVEITGDGNQLNGQYITIGTSTKGYYVQSSDVSISSETLADIQSKPYAKFQISGTSGDYTFTIHVISDHAISTAGEPVNIQITIGSTTKTVQIYAYPPSS